MKGWRRFHHRRPKQARSVTARAKPVARESAEGSALIDWCDLVGYPFTLLYHIANEGSGSAVRGVKLKREGLRAGVADYCLPIARHGWNTLYIELKAKDGMEKQEQLDWCQLMVVEGNMARVVWGWPAAAEILAHYVGSEKALRMLPDR